MKKTILTFLIMMFFAGFCAYAATSASGTTIPSADGANSATVPVTFNISGTGDDAQYSWEIGFTSSTDVNLDAENPVEIINSIPLKYGEGSQSSQGVSDGNVGVYWIIKGNPPQLEISLGAEGAMTGNTDTNKINWAISWGESPSITTIGSSETEYANGQQSISYEAKSVHESETEKTIDADVMPLSIVTQNIENAAVDSYSGNLVLTITQKEGGTM